MNPASIVIALNQMNCSIVWLAMNYQGHENRVFFISC
jgi:hypothetical protein